MASTAHPLPGALRLAPSLPFVGRAQELAAARTLLPRAEDETGRVLLVGGEPGSGKSRLVREFAEEAAGAGVLVLYGACDAVVRTPYGPLVEALDHLVRVVDEDVLRADLGTSGGELTRLLPDLRRQFAELPDPVAGDPDTERHRLHIAVTELLTSVARRQTIVLVLEDGHWADVPTLLFLRHFARAGAGARTLLLATFRDTDAEMPADLADALADLRRAENTVRLHLEGLTEDEIAEFVRRAAGAEDRALAHSIADLTSGNPFLVCELWRELGETGALAAGEVATPQSVRDVVSQRLLRLGAATTELLELAAVAGREFELDLLLRAAPLDDAAVAAALDQAVSSGIVEEVPRGRLAYRSRTSSTAARSTTASARCAAPSCTSAWPRRSRRRRRRARRATSPTSPTTSRRPRRSAGPRGPSSTASWRPTRPPRPWPMRRRRRTCGRPSSWASTTSAGARRPTSRSARRATGAAPPCSRSRPSAPPPSWLATWGPATCWPGRQSATRPRAGGRD